MHMVFYGKSETYSFWSLQIGKCSYRVVFLIKFMWIYMLFSKIVRSTDFVSVYFKVNCLVDSRHHKSYLKCLRRYTRNGFKLSQIQDFVYLSMAIFFILILFSFIQMSFCLSIYLPKMSNPCWGPRLVRVLSCMNI